MNTLHTHAIFAEAIDKNGNARHIGLLFRHTDCWFSNNGATDLDKMNSKVAEIMRADSNIVAFQNAHYELKDGIYKMVREYWPQLSK